MSYSSDILMLKTKLPTYTNTEMQDRILDRIHDVTDRKIMLLKLIDGYTLLRISDKLDIPYSTVKDHYYTCRKLLFDTI